MNARIDDRSNGPGREGRDRSPGRSAILFAALFLVCLVSVAFFPILGFEFIDMDVPDQVIDNPHIRAITWQNLKHIFTSRCITSYYPVRTLTYAIDFQIWGLDPGGFKATNALIHVINVLLLFWLILRLFRRPESADVFGISGWDVSVAAFSAGVLAIHPVVVEPVTWVPGREELLMTLGTLGCFHAHLTARRSGSDHDRWLKPLAWHLAAAVFCAMACLSNAVGAVIPLLITTWDMITLARPKLWKILSGTSLLWLIGAATIVIKRLGYIGETSALGGVFSGEWLALVLRTYWLNLKTLARPTKLALSYEWFVPTTLLQTDVIFGGVALIVTCALAWRLRRRKLLLFGLFWFGLALAPSSQIVPHHMYRSDRFLYLPLVGLALAAAIGLRPIGKTPKTRGAAAAATVAGVLLLLVLELLSICQVRTWRNSISVWAHCVRVAPRCAFGHHCLASSLASAGRFDLAVPHYETALSIDPNDTIILDDYAYRLSSCRDERLRDYDRAIRLAEAACALTERKDPGVRRTLALAYMNFATHLKREGQFEEAVKNYHKAIAADPTYEVPLFNLALLLAGCDEERSRRPEEAVRLAEQACQLIESPGSLQLSILAEVYAKTGRMEQAMATLGEAIRAAEAEQQIEWSNELRRRLMVYQEGHPRGAREGQP